MTPGSVTKLPGASLPAVGEPPQDMSEMARAKWVEASGEWAQVLTVTDRDALRLYCEAWAEMIYAQEKVAEGGSMVLTPSGQIQKSPWLTKVEQNREFCRKMIAAFGGMPNSREKAAKNTLGGIKL